jgi:ubiquinone biosynthesis protein
VECRDPPAGRTQCAISWPRRSWSPLARLTDERRLERAVGALLVRHPAPGTTGGAAAFAALFRVVTSHRLGIPTSVAAVFRAFAVLEGTLTVLDPHSDQVTQARETGRARMAEAMRPDQLRRSVEEELASLLPTLRRLPRRVDRVADAVEHGRLTVNVRLFADVRDRRLVTGLLQQVLLTGLGAAAALTAVCWALPVVRGSRVRSSSSRCSGTAC